MVVIIALALEALEIVDVEAIEMIEPPSDRSRVATVMNELPSALASA